MSIRKRLQFLECQAKPVTATEPGTSEAARALAFIAKWKARIDADPEAWAAGAEARAAARRETRIRLGIDLDRKLTPADFLRLMDNIRTKRGEQSNQTGRCSLARTPP